MSHERILIVDDDASICQTLQLYLQEQGYQILICPTGRAGLEALQATAVDLVILDIRLSDMDGLQVLEAMKALQPHLPIIMITAFHDLSTTVEAMRRGAFEYVHKPIDIETLEHSISRGLVTQRRHSLHPQNLIPVDRNFHAGDVIGKSKEMVEIFKAIGLVSQNKATVLIEGETGTGKELIARAIHDFSDPDQPFISVNCSAIVETLMESELFGYEKGAFTGAAQRTPGKFELAGAGTLFLDEISELPLNMQAKLLRVIQEREFQRVGGSELVSTDARVVTATNCDLAGLVREGKFREDLFYRLRVVSMKVPPLRERRSDIPLLTQYLVNKINEELKKDIRWIPEAVMQRLVAHEWKGNVRELENTLRRAILFCPQQVLLEEHLFLGDEREGASGRPAASAGVPEPAKKTLAEMEREYISQVLQSTGGNRSAACRLLGISHPTLLRKIRKYSLPY